MLRERWLDKLNQKFGRYGIRNLMIYIVGGMHGYRRKCCPFFRRDFINCIQNAKRRYEWRKNTGNNRR